MANDTSLRLPHPTGATIYTIIFAPGTTQTAWNGTAYATFAVASWTTFATSTPETPASSGFYVAAFPTSSAAGNYHWVHYLQAGASPASTDAVVGGNEGYWDGSTFGNVGAVTAEITLPATAPLGYGPIGTGSVTVNQDYPTTGNLKFTDSSGDGVGGALVLAYLASEYTANPNTAVIRGQTLTLDSGSWANNMQLDPAAYKIVFKASGYEDTVVSQTVS